MRIHIPAIVIPGFTIEVEQDGQSAAPAIPGSPTVPAYVKSRFGEIFTLPLDFAAIAAHYGFASDDEDKYKANLRSAEKIIEDMDNRKHGPL